MWLFSYSWHTHYTAYVSRYIQVRPNHTRSCRSNDTQYNPRIIAIPPYPPSSPFVMTDYYHPIPLRRSINLHSSCFTEYDNISSEKVKFYLPAGRRQKSCNYLACSLPFCNRAVRMSVTFAQVSLFSGYWPFVYPPHGGAPSKRRTYHFNNCSKWKIHVIVIAFVLLR